MIKSISIAFTKQNAKEQEKTKKQVKKKPLLEKSNEKSIQQQITSILEILVNTETFTLEKLIKKKPKNENN